MTRTFAHRAIRSFALGSAFAAIAAAPMSAHALGLALSLPTNAIQADAIQAFSPDAQGANELVGITIEPRGNATAVPGTPGAYNLPVTSISLQLTGVAGGASTGSALEFNRINEDTGLPKRVTLANFRIDFTTRQVLADATQSGKGTVANTPIFNFHEKTPLGLKYRFPLGLGGQQVLDQLFLTPEAKKVFMEGLELPDFTEEVLSVLDFGTITVNVVAMPRTRPVSSRPYVVAP
ncbi:MAG: hypothetical protein IIA02_17165 [Proteobacteria bacterium]|uniref:hypothetical protein n=1 Tax=Aquabacterium sp. TaxID=1872578 RepID=UPI0035C75DCA|nr:hypothetical protein [Pseudomonadota bacterium]